MRQFGIKILIMLLIFSYGLITSCKKKDKPTTGDINITIVPLQGQTVDVSMLSVELHWSALYNNVAYTTAASGSSTSSTANFSKIPPGTYYLMAWRDKDNDGQFTTGDIFGFHVEPLTVAAGKKYSVTLKMYKL